MRKIIKPIIMMLMLACMMLVLGACMRMVRIEPPGFAEAMERVEGLEVEVRSVTYAPPQNQIHIELYVNIDALTRETSEQLSEALDEYMSSEQFITFMQNLEDEEVNIDTLNRNLHLFDFDGVHIP